MIEVLTGMSGGYVQKVAGSEFPYWIGYHYPFKSLPGGYIFIARGSLLASPHLKPSRWQKMEAILMPFLKQPFLLVQ